MRVRGEDGALPELGQLRMLVGLRVVVVTTLIISAFLIQLTFSIGLPLKPVYYLAAFAYVHSIAALVSLERMRPETNAAMQLLGDIVVVTGLVWISLGPDSSFTFLYLGVVASGAILLGRLGGLVAAGLASVFYAVLVALLHQGVLPLPETGDPLPRVWQKGALVGNVALNVSAFLATALLVSSASGHLRQARAEARRRQDEVERLQALHSSVLSSMTSGLLTTDDGGVVTYANPSAGELLLTTSGSLVGRPALELGLVEPAAWKALSHGGREMVREETNRTALGPSQFFGVSLTPLRGPAGEVSGRLLIFQNLTAFKRLEGEVRLKEKMAAVGELASAITHEIRNPLASISGAAQALRGSAGPGSADRRLLDIVVGESNRLSRILEDFLRYTRPRQRAAERLDAAAALREVLTLAAHSDELSPGHRLESDVQPPSALLVGDEGQLRQVFWNLLRNALAAMPGGGELRVTARASGGLWSVSFADEGRGMTEEERQQLFTPFAHAGREGTGLGLAIVYRIVEDHGGTIEVDTAPGRGSTISLSFPTAEPEPAALRERAAVLA